MENEKKYNKDDAYQTLGLINSWINNIDTKASFALAFQAVVIGFCFNNGWPSAIDKIVNTLPKDRIILDWICAIAVVLFIVGSALSALFLLLTLVAKTKNTTGKKSVMFFGTIAASSLNDYKSKVMNMSDVDLTKDLLEQVHTNSCICTVKFKRYSTGMKIMIPVFIYGIIILSCGLI